MSSTNISAGDWRWIVVVLPRGDVVRLDESWNTYTPEQLLHCVLTGELEHGTRVTVRGNHVSLVWRSDEQRAVGPLELQRFGLLRSGLAARLRHEQAVEGGDVA